MFCVFELFGEDRVKTILKNVFSPGGYSVSKLTACSNGAFSPPARSHSFSRKKPVHRESFLGRKPTHIALLCIEICKIFASSAKFFQNPPCCRAFFPFSPPTCRAN